MEVRRAEGEPSRSGVEGERLGSGVTDEIFALEGGGRAWFGVAADPFIGNGPALNAFVKALAAGNADFTPFDNRVDIFANRNVTAIVLEVPSDRIGTGRVGAWASISLHGHAPQRQVARAAWPLMRHLFIRDEHAGAHLNEGPPTCVSRECRGVDRRQRRQGRPPDQERGRAGTVRSLCCKPGAARHPPVHPQLGRNIRIRRGERPRPFRSCLRCRPLDLREPRHRRIGRDRPVHAPSSFSLSGSTPYGRSRNSSTSEVARI